MPHKRNTKRRDRKKSDSVTTSEIHTRILQALNNQDYVARTVSGIAKEAHTSPVIIVQAIKTDPNLKTVVKVFPRRTKTGEILLTTRERFHKKASIKDKFIDLFSTTQVSIDDAH